MSVALTLVCCLGTSGCKAAQAGESWSVCLYICGSDLETKTGRASQTIDEILAADLPQNVSVIIQTGGAKKWHTNGVSATNVQRFEVKDHQLIEIASLPNASLGKSSTLSDFLTFCASEYPAQHTAVICWDHGGGPSRGLCFDQNFGGDALELAELGSALKDGASAQGAPYDLIGLDACLMATLETASTVSPYANYLVASQEIEPGSGWDYTALLKAAAAANNDAASVARATCDGYAAKYEDANSGRSLTLSVVNLKKMDQVVSQFEAVAAEEDLQMRQDADSAIAKLASNAHACQPFGLLSQNETHANVIDLGDFCSRSNDENASAAANALAAAVEYSVAGPLSQGASGLSVYYPLGYDASELLGYGKSTPLAHYAKLLEDGFASYRAENIRYSQDAEAKDKSTMCATISSASLPYVVDISTQLEQVGTKGRTMILGEDNDIVDFWEQGYFESSFPTKTLTLNGIPLSTTLVDYNYDAKVPMAQYSAPVMVDGTRTNLLFTVTFEDEANPHFEIQGIWNGFDKNGMAPKGFEPLKDGSTISIVRRISDETGAMRESTGDSVVVDSSLTVSFEPLASGEYRYRFVITDVFGNKSLSSPIPFNME